MAKSNIKIETQEIKLSGVLNTGDIANGVLTLESEEDGTINLSEQLVNFADDIVEIIFKRKIETSIAGE